MMHRTFLTLMFILSTHTGLCFASPEAIAFIPTREDRQVITSLESLVDPTGTYSIEQIINGQAGPFTPHSNTNLSVKDRYTVRWVRFSIQENEPTSPFWFLIYNYEHIGTASLFYKEQGAYKKIEMREESEIKNRTFSIQDVVFQVPRSTEKIATYYMRLDPQGHWPKIELIKSNTKGLIENIHIKQLIIGLFFGGMAALWVYNFVFLIYLRDKIYLYYLYYLTACIALFFYLDGLVPLVFSWNPYNTVLFSLCGYATIHGSILFAREFLELNIHAKTIDRILQVMQWVVGIWGVIILFLPIGMSLQYLTYFAVLTSPFLILAAIVRWRQGSKPAMIYAMGWAVFAAGIINVFLGILSFLPATNFNFHVIQFGSLIEAQFFAVAIAYRIKLADSQNKAKLNGLIKEQQILLSKEQASLELAKKATAGKNAFLGMISHELRTPLQGIISSIDLLTVRNLDKHTSELMDRLTSSAEHLALQMRDLTDYAKLDSGNVHFNYAPCNASKLIANAVANFRSMATEKALNLTANIQGENIEVLIDSVRFQQIANNLIENAIKYTNNGTIKVDFYYQQTESGLSLSLSVKDSGIGISNEHLRDIFEPFTQFDRTHFKKHEGVGMGLSIVKRLVDLFQGTVSVDSIVDQGSTFMVTIPVELASPPQTMAIDENKNSTTEENILVVDDTEAVLDSLKEVIERLGYSCEVSSNGSDAINKISAKRYDAILLDVNMPKIDGFMVAAAIREATSPNYKTDIIWISATPPEMISKDQNNLFSLFLQKPVRMSQLKNMFDKIFLAKLEDKPKV